MESLERELLDKEKLFSDCESKISKIGSDLGWLVKEGVVRIINKIIELPDFPHDIARFKNMFGPLVRNLVGKVCVSRLLLGRLILMLVALLPIILEE